jgi:hypothetical protein
VFSAFLVARPGERLETVFAYDLPGYTVARSGEESRYRLVVQKQPGTRAHPIEVHLYLPTGADIAASKPAPTERRGSTLVYRLELETDLVIEVLWKAGGAPYD